MKKLFRKTAIISAFMMLGIILFGCSNPLSAITGSKPGFEVAISEAFTCGPADDQVLIVNLDVHNTSKKNDVDVNLLTYNTQIMVNGIALSNSYGGYNNPYLINNPSVISPGNSGLVQLVYEAKNLTGAGTATLSVSETTKKGKQTVFTTDIDLTTIATKKSTSQYAFSIEDGQITDDGEGGDILALTVNFKNNSSEAKSMGSAIEYKLFQNGKELSTTWLPYKHPWSEDNSMDAWQDIQPGSEVTLRLFYALEDSTTDIDFTAVDWSTFDKVEVCKQTIKTSEVSRAVFGSEYEFVYKTAVIGMDKWGKDYIVMLVGEFKNNSSEPVKFSSVCDCKAVQSGFTLSNAYLTGSTDFTYREVRPGESTLIYVGWKIMTTESVEFRIIDRYHYAKQELFVKSFTLSDLVNNTKSFGDDDNMLDKEIGDEGQVNL